MFKYAPGMESGLGAALNMMRKHAEPDGDEANPPASSTPRLSLKP